MAAREKARRATRERRRITARDAAAARRSDVAARRERGDTEDAQERAARYAATSARHAARERRRLVKETLAAPWSDGGAAGLRVAIELGWEDTMNERERASLSTQVTHAYGSVLRRCAEERLAPLRMALTGCARAADTLARIDKAGGAEKWPVPRLEPSFAEALPAVCSPAEDGAARGTPVRIVVMSPDAEEPLREVAKDAVYVVGGLCDYKRSVQTTLNGARASGVCARRLPLAETLGASVPSVTILTVDQCVAALHLAHANGGDWGAALRAALPQRKLRAVEAPSAMSGAAADDKAA